MIVQYCFIYTIIYQCKSTLNVPNPTLLRLRFNQVSLALMVAYGCSHKRKPRSLLLLLCSIAMLTHLVTKRIHDELTNPPSTQSVQNPAFPLGRELCFWPKLYTQCLSGHQLEQRNILRFHLQIIKKV